MHPSLGSTHTIAKINSKYLIYLRQPPPDNGSGQCFDKRSLNFGRVMCMTGGDEGTPGPPPEEAPWIPSSPPVMHITHYQNTETAWQNIVHFHCLGGADVANGSRSESLA